MAIRDHVLKRVVAAPAKFNFNRALIIQSLDELANLLGRCRLAPRKVIMIKFENPASVAPPFGHYSHAALVGKDARWLHVSGQVGVKPDGSMAKGIEAQCEWAWKNLLGILESSGMGLADVVKTTTYLVNADHVAAFRSARDRVIGEHRPASTLVVVQALASPEWLVEIELQAARA
jgi:enamine deaminase RidA (YjgF/YER057c/UK114 family)